MSGRQMLWMVYDWFAKDEEFVNFEDIEHLMRVKCHNDDLETCQRDWNRCLSRFRGEGVDESIKLKLYYRNIYKSKRIEMDINRFDRTKCRDRDWHEVQCYKCCRRLS